MKTYDYMSLFLDDLVDLDPLDPKALEKKLKEFGQQGWKLQGVVWPAAPNPLFLFQKAETTYDRSA